jgi:type II secretory pathway component PulF
MPTFEYQATNARGESVRGLEHAPTMDQVIGRLQQQGLNVTSIGIAAANTGVDSPMVRGQENPANGPMSTGSREISPPLENRNYFQTSVWGPIAGQVPLKDLAFFFRRASTMLEAGVPFVQTLGTLSGQAKNPKLGTIVREMQRDVESGRPMSFAMQRYPEVFGAVSLSMVRAGEEGGFLDRALSDVADYLDRDLQLRNLYKRIIFYPKLQVGASIVIVIGANLIIASISSKAQQLSSPLTTPSTWFWLGPLIVILFLFLRVGLANPQIRYGWDTLLTNLPVFGKIMKELAMARFGRAFGAMYRSGVPMTRAMQISSDACGNEFLRARMYTAVKVLETGAGVTETLKSTQAFSPIVLDMVHTGETTGNLDQMLNKMSEFYEDEVQTKSTQLAYIVGVLLGLFVAIYIGYIVIGFYSGYFSGITNAVGE